MAGRPREYDYNEALDAAMRVFWAKGFEGTSMPDLTDAMGMNKPSIYAAFGNKEELFEKALDRYHEKMQAFLKETLSAPTAREAISAFFKGVAMSFSCPENPKGCFSVVSALVGSDATESVRRMTLRRREAFFVALHERLEQGIRDGDLPAGTDTKSLARFYVTVLQGMSVQSASGACDQDLCSVAGMAVSVLPG